MSNYPPGTSAGDPRAPWNQSFPPGVEDVFEMIILWPEAPLDEVECDRCEGGVYTYPMTPRERRVPCRTCDGTGLVKPLAQFGRITDYSEWEEAERDEEGGVCRYGGVELEVTSLASGERCTIPLDDVEEWMIPAEPSELRDAADALEKALAFDVQAKRARERCDRLLRAAAGRA